MFLSSNVNSASMYIYVVTKHISHLENYTLQSEYFHKLASQKVNDVHYKKSKIHIVERLSPFGLTIFKIEVSTC